MQYWDKKHKCSFDMLYFVFSFCSSFCRKDNTRQKLSTKTIDLRSKTDLQFHHEFQLQFIPPTVVQEHFQDHSGYKRKWHCTFGSLLDPLHNAHIYQIVIANRKKVDFNFQTYVHCSLWIALHISC